MPCAKSTYGVSWMPNRAHEPRLIQSSRLACRNAYLMRKVRLPCERTRWIGLARDVGRDAEGQDVGQVAGDVDVAARDVEAAAVDEVAVAVRDLRLGLIAVVREDGGSDADGRRVVGRLGPGRRGSPGRQRVRGVSTTARRTPRRAPTRGSCADSNRLLCHRHYGLVTTVCSCGFGHGSDCVTPMLNSSSGGAGRVQPARTTDG